MCSRRFILVLVAWSAVWVPFEFGFIPSPVPTIMYLDGAVDLAFLTDIALRFVSAVRCPKSLKLITSKAVIAKRSCRSLLFMASI